MLTIPPNTRISLCTSPVDMRKSFDGLIGVVCNQLGDDPLAGHLFVFLNRYNTLAKILEKSEKLSKEKTKDESSSDETSGNTDSNNGRKKRTKNGGGGRIELPANFECAENVVDVPEEERTCDCCGKLFKCIGDERSVTAESPIKTIDKGVASTSVDAAIAVMKYADHLLPAAGASGDAGLQAKRH